MKIKFDEASHTYTHKDTDEKFISVTTLLGKYKQPFDRDGHSMRVAKREGVSQEMVLEMWEQEKHRACKRGTDIHKLLEDYINFGDVGGGGGPGGSNADWMHINAIDYNPILDQIAISSRHQNEIYIIDPKLFV